MSFFLYVVLVCVVFISLAGAILLGKIIYKIIVSRKEGRPHLIDTSSRRQMIEAEPSAPPLSDFGIQMSHVDCTASSEQPPKCFIYLGNGSDDDDESDITIGYGRDSPPPTYEYVMSQMREENTLRVHIL